jgi:hypothetical protein
VLFYRCKAGAVGGRRDGLARAAPYVMRLAKLRGVRLQPDQIDLGMLTIISANLIMIAFEIETWRMAAHRIGVHHVQPAGVQLRE